jgi:hypothetical protein
MACSEKSPKLVHVKYQDHVLFRNTDPHQLQPSKREAIGWLIKETEKAIWILFDRPVEAQPLEKPDPASGLIILRSDVLEIREIE